VEPARSGWGALGGCGKKRRAPLRTALRGADRRSRERGAAFGLRGLLRLPVRDILNVGCFEEGGKNKFLSSLFYFILKQQKQ
jgi:hypothetical protein